MNNHKFPFALLTILLAFESHAGGKSTVTWMTFDQGMAEAQRTGKKVMIDVYTDWCGWCKKMDKDTYADKSVGEYLHKNYISIKLDAESGSALRYQGQSYTERELAAAFGINGYPSVIFLDHDGKPITVYPGYADANNFKVVLSYIGGDHYKTTKFQDYVQALQ